jgi:hypothetical protein
LRPAPQKIAEQSALEIIVPFVALASLAAQCALAKSVAPTHVKESNAAVDVQAVIALVS